MERFGKYCSQPAGRWIIFVSIALFITGFWLPRNWGFYGSGDWDLTYSTFEAARLAVVEYKQWPSYQPWLAFGSDLDANPQAVHASVFFIPVLLFGTFYGYKVAILVAILIGLFGAFRLFCKLGASDFVSVFTSIVFCAAPYFSRHIFEAGHSNFLHFYFFPALLLHLLILSERFSLKSTLLSFLIFSHTLTGGAPQTFIVFSAFTLLLAAGLIWTKKAGIQALPRLILPIVFGLGTSLWKILPALSLWESTPRLVNDDSGINLLVWLKALFDLPSNTGTPHAWHEFAVGIPPALAALVLYRFRDFPNRLKWIILFIPLIWTGLGNMPPYLNPWYLMHHSIPFFGSIRAPYRVGIVVLLLCCSAFVYLASSFRNKSLVYIILIASAFTQCLSYNSISGNLVFSQRPEKNELKTGSTFTPVKNTTLFRQFPALRKQHLIPHAYEPLVLSEVTDTPEYFVSGARLIKFSPSRIEFKAERDTTGFMLRYSPHWKADSGGKTFEKNGLLFVSGARNSSCVSYQNPGFAKGLRLSLLSLILFSVWLVFAAYRKKSSA